ncbi:MAG: hypothetical protein AAF610_06595 [Pseudomonadota bacterium]
MLEIFRAYTDIALLRRGPESLPYSVPLLVITIVLVLSLAFIAPTVPGWSLTAVMLVNMTEVLMITSIVWLLLNAISRTERCVQTLTAIFGARFVLSLLQIAVQVVGGFEDSLAAQSMTPAFAMTLLLEFWFYVVWSRALRASLGITLLQSIAVIVLTTVLMLGLLSLILPGVGVAV